MKVLEENNKQFLVFSNAGKPILCLGGNEEDLSSLMATARALMSVSAQKCCEKLKYVRHQRCVIAFMDDGPLCLVASSTLGEGPGVLHSQMQLVHGLVISLLTYSALQSVYTRSPGYDIRRLLNGIDSMLECLVKSFLSSPAALLAAYQTMPLAKNDRIIVLDVLKEALQVPGAICSIILSSGQIVGISSGKRQRFHYGDILLLSNFLISNRTALKAAETMTPICLPNYNRDAHLQAYIQFFDLETDSVVVLLSGTSSNEGVQAIKALSTVTENLNASGILSKIVRSTSVQNFLLPRNTSSSSTISSALHNIGLDSSEVYHYAYKLTKCQQFVSGVQLPEGARFSLQDIMIAYGQLRAAMFDERTAETCFTPVQSLRYELRSEFAVLAMASSDAELYVVTSHLTPKSTAVKAVGELARRLRAQHVDCFF